MAYTPTEWVSGETPLSAENMNHIEQGIADLNSNKIVVVKDIVVALNISKGNSGIVGYTFPTMSGYTRALIAIRSVSGNGTGSVVLTIHGAPDGSIYGYAPLQDVSAQITLRCIYIKDENYTNMS